MVDLRAEGLKEPFLGETTYFQPAIGTSGTTKWDEFESQFHESSTREHEPKPLDRSLKKGSSISTRSANEGGSCQIRTSLDGWKYPKVPLNRVYNCTDHSLWSKARKMLNNSPSKTIKEYEKTITLKSNNNQINLSLELLKYLNMIEDGIVDLGLFQVAIKPLSNDEGLGGSIIACIRCTAFIEFMASVKALVKENVCDGPFYFNCYPCHSIPSSDPYWYTLSVISEVPLVLTYRVVCNVRYSVFDNDHITSCYRKPIIGETTCYHPITGTESTTKWDEVQVSDSDFDLKTDDGSFIFNKYKFVSSKLQKKHINDI